MTGPSPVAQPEPLHVVIAGTKFGYPEGAGAAARAHAYATGLIHNDAAVKVVSLLTPDPEGAGVNVAVAGVYEGVAFEYACGTRVRCPTFLGRRLLELKVPLGLLRALRQFFASAAGAKAIIAYTDQPAWIALIAVLAKLTDARCIVEVAEVPMINERGRVRVSVKRLVQRLVSYRMVDGFITISSFLEDYVRARAPRRAAFIRIPILVNVPDVPLAVALRTSAQSKRIVYLGQLGNTGEIADLLAAFALVAPCHSEAMLELVGGGSSGMMDDLVAQVADLGLNDRVVFAGWAKREDLPELLASAAMLVLPRRDGLFSRAGFPTKLGEYLASGRPVVATTTGEIAQHLTHAESAYLAPPGNPAAFAEQMMYVLEHDEEASEVGARGRALAAQQFSSLRHGARLKAFLCDLR